MLVMVTEATGFKEELRIMKAILDRLFNKSVEKTAQIKRQNE